MIYCITGLPGVGKTYLLNKFKSNYSDKVCVIEADEIVHNILYKKGHPCFEKLTKTFLMKNLVKNDEIDRNFLFNLIFKFPDEIEKLNKAVWPFLRKEINNIILEDPRPIKLVELGIYLRSNNEFSGLFDDVILITRPYDELVEHFQTKKNWDYAKLKSFYETFFPDFNISDYQHRIDNSTHETQTAVMKLELFLGVFINYGR